MTRDISLDGKTVARGAALAVLLAAGSAHADPAGMRTYRTLAMTASGERIAAVEAVEGEARTGPRIVVRDTATGRIASTWQKSDCPQCRLESLAWAPDQKTLAAIVADPGAGTASVVLVRDGRVTTPNQGFLWICLACARLAPPLAGRPAETCPNGAPRRYARHPPCATRTRLPFDTISASGSGRHGARPQVGVRAAAKVPVTARIKARSRSRRSRARDR